MPKKYILLNNFGGSKHNLLMNFGQFHIPIEIIWSKYYTKTVTWKLGQGPFVFAKN